jgi:proline iminopeptidase
MYGSGDGGREGSIATPGGQVWYRVVGSAQGTPLLTLHGGPGFSHYYLAPLEALADERPVVFYDQLGCGRSERPEAPELWRIERFVAELAAVQRALGLDRFHLLGHSWGTMLAVDYALTRPGGLTSLILASPCLSIARYQADVEAYRRQLPQAVQDAMAHHEASGTTDSAEYQAAALEFSQRHVFRHQPIPEALAQSMQHQGLPAYWTMWGPSEFCVTGNLADYDRTDRLGEIAVPTLFTCGRYDETTPGATTWYASMVRGAEVVVFDDSAHLPHLEEPERYVEVVGDFLQRVEEDAIG